MVPAGNAVLTQALVHSGPSRLIVNPGPKFVTHAGIF